MRLSDVLSKEPTANFVSVDNFAPKNYIKIGCSNKIDVGKVFINLKCNNCNEVHQFYSDDLLYFMPINADMISIDCRLTCQYCGKVSVPVWFLVQVEGAILSSNKMSVGFLSNMKVRLLYKHFKFSADAEPVPLKYKKEYSDLLIKADQAYHNGLGAGALVYLRKLFEKVTIDIASANGIPYQNNKGKKLTFKDILDRVENQYPIIPPEFSANGYKLFGELSDIVHDSSVDEETGIKKYTSLRRLIVGILDNIKDKEELSAAAKELAWSI